MKTFQKTKRHDSLFPFSFIYQDTKSPQKELSDHMHDDYEIVYVYSGKGSFFIGDVFYDMQPGDVFLIPNNTIHRAIPDKDDPVTSTIIFFSPTLIYNVLLDDSFSYQNLFEMTKKRGRYKIPIQKENQKVMENHLQRINNEITQKRLGSRHASLLIVHQIILDLYRIRAENEHDIKEKAYGLDWIKDILEYINKNLSKKLTLTELANKCLVSPSYFSRTFKEETGIGLINYLNTKRIIKAKELLLETNDSVAHIGEMCGFESMTHFHRIFKKYMDTTPANYRKRTKIRI
ncbi:AraC-like DNA-binding protein [Scopulibacillus darangshiensis]|uniref:AraC-like DNA-binding protein n=1 Tax=Scopulibacillus darangshiensis TaxID=442528 RepID=A0A4R2NIR2_9BACL|nr:helix-turn-helix domain-containing protein [Scopulibacillus darangshiensis]TCP21280.1 AraC-like DNA-binding protein [Scopulibacillus darangshiensis]